MVTSPAIANGSFVRLQSYWESPPLGPSSGHSLQPVRSHSCRLLSSLAQLSGSGSRRQPWLASGTSAAREAPDVFGGIGHEWSTRAVVRGEADGVRTDRRAGAPEYPRIPPGPIVLVVLAAAIMLGTTRWRWLPLIGGLLSLQITIGAFATPYTANRDPQTVHDSWVEGHRANAPPGSTPARW